MSQPLRVILCLDVIIFLDQWGCWQSWPTPRSTSPPRWLPGPCRTTLRPCLKSIEQYSVKPVLSHSNPFIHFWYKKAANNDSCNCGNMKQDNLSDGLLFLYNFMESSPLPALQGWTSLAVFYCNTILKPWYWYCNTTVENEQYLSNTKTKLAKLRLRPKRCLGGFIFTL